MFSKILSFFGGLKLTAIMGGVIAFLLWLLKIFSMQKENLENKVAAHEKEDEIQDDMRLSDIKTEGEKNEALEDNDGSDHADYI